MPAHACVITLGLASDGDSVGAATGRTRGSGTGPFGLPAVLPVVSALVAALAAVARVPGRCRGSGIGPRIASVAGRASSAAVRGGDVVMVKGSLGSRMGPLVKALARRFPHHEAAAPAAAQG